MEIRKSGAALGAEIRGIDLSQPLDDKTFQQIVDAFHEHEVVFFRDQTLTPDQHVAFSRRFGELEHHVRADRCRPGYPELFVVSNVIENGKPIGSQDAGLFWHSDLCYMAEPSRGSIFYAREVPVDDSGEPLGDTLFASATAAYDALPESTRQRISGLQAINSYAKGYYRDRNSGPRPELTEEQKKKTPDMPHPIARTHPYTGRKCLFVNEGYTSRIVGMDGPEGDTLLNELLAHATEERFIYRHKWRVGDLLIWDNCSTQHLAIPNYQLPKRRLMERATVKGSRPF
ncbi:MAG TPA: TauD/TfdA family dioxygenase [Burkholderiales bacterium]|nr:TauD/TfdA family dioxygenase [Burkholderiales bacterium]